MNNPGIIFKRTLWDARMGIIGWGIGIGLITLLIVTLFPTITQFEGFGEMLESPIYKALLGEAADAAAFLTPEGFLAIYVVAFTPVYLAVYLVMMGLGVTAGEEERGTIDLLMSTPTPRWQVIVEKFLAILVIIVLILAINYVLGLIGLLITPEVAVSPVRLAEGSLAMLPISALMTALALLLGTVTRSRGVAGGIAGAVIIASYMITTLSEVATDALGAVKPFSFFTYHHSIQIMREGIQWGDFLLLSVVTAALVGLGIFFFQRRDLAV
ncbi:MAG: ABC transporter permease subunit [Anaerolineaceae bacterium]|nr:ABC transporter permease subunit [Anaerolineaceae bacterium]